jgi:EAL domain-containing protein (putative c-di-GMP-specific phosphodiesterase class I)
MGVELAIDDFGTGYSNLGYLRRFQIGRLKVDRSFVQRLGNNAHDEAIVRAVVQMAQSLGLRTVAEGVETEAQREHLQRLGCEQAQGFLWHPALTPSVCEGLWRGA